MMSAHEVDEAIKELRAAWYTPLSEAAERVWRRTLPGIGKEEFKAVRTDFVGRGFGRPPPAEFYELCRLKGGKAPAGQRVHRDGPYLDVSDPDITPTGELGGEVAKLREAMGR